MKRLLLFITLVSLLACAGCSTEAVSPSQVTIPTSTANTDLSGETKTDDTKADNDKTSKKDDSVFEIREKMFIAQCNDIYLNLKDFEGRTVKIEGFCDTDIDPETGKTYYGVIRKGPGCCGNDGVAGFEFTYGGQYPKQNDWLEVVGKITVVKKGNYDVVVIDASKVTVKTTRGADFVSN